jgi:SAM-dependent methyltransferase
VPEEGYEAAEYWERLLSADFTIAGVSHPYLPQSYNRFLYRAMERSLRRALRHAPLAPALESCRVLDVGSGVGLWLEFWRRCGVARLAAVDLTETSVQRLAVQYPDVSVTQADIASDDLSRLGSFDVISTVNVLLHLTDDDAFAAALENLASALAPGGVLLVIDPVIVTRSWRPTPDHLANSKARALDEWREAIAGAGLRLLYRFPVTVLLDSPVDTRSSRSFRLRARFWDTLCRGLCERETRGAIAGAVLYAVDTVLVRLSRTGPSLKCLVIAPE